MLTLGLTGGEGGWSVSQSGVGEQEPGGVPPGGDDNPNGDANQNGGRNQDNNQNQNRDPNQDGNPKGNGGNPNNGPAGQDPALLQAWQPDDLAAAINALAFAKQESKHDDVTATALMAAHGMEVQPAPAGQQEIVALTPEAVLVQHKEEAGNHVDAIASVLNESACEAQEKTAGRLDPLVAAAVFTAGLYQSWLHETRAANPFPSKTRRKDDWLDPIA